MSKILISVSRLDNLPSHVDGYVLGYEKYTFFAEHLFSYEEIKDFKEPRKIYLLLNVMLHEKDLNDFIIEVDKLVKLDINFIVQDLGMVEILKKKVDPSRIIYNPYTLVCNLKEYRTYHAYLGTSIGVSSQLSLDNLKEFKGHSFIQIYGYTPIYQSYRKIISLYNSYHHKNIDKSSLVKEDTRDENYHIDENEYGTVILSSEKINLLDKIDELKNSEYLFINFDKIDEKEKEQILQELTR